MLRRMIFSYTWLLFAAGVYGGDIARCYCLARSVRVGADCRYCYLIQFCFMFLFSVRVGGVYTRWTLHFRVSLWT